MRKKKLILAVTLMFLVGVLSCQKKTTKNPGANLDTSRSQAKGVATIYDDDKALARDRAIDDAMNKLVKKVLGTTIQGKQLIQDYEMVEDIIETKTSGMVKNWKVLDEVARGNMYEVTLEGEVYPAAVGDTIAATIKNYGRPKFMILVQEKIGGKTSMPGMTITEAKMIEIMDKFDFEFVDAAITQQLMKSDRSKMQQAMSGNLGSSTVKDKFFDIGAEILIVGTVDVKDQTGAVRNMGLSQNAKSKVAIMTLKAVDISTGNIMGSITANGRGLDINGDAAAQKAIVQCVEKVIGSTDDDDGGKFVQGSFLKQMTRKFLKAANQRSITTLVRGLNYDELKKFRNALLERIRGVKSVETRGASGRDSRLDVTFAGRTIAFSDELKNKSGKIGFDIDIIEFKPNKVLISVKKN